MRLSTLFAIMICVITLGMYVVNKPTTYDLRTAEGLAAIEAMILEKTKDKQLMDLHIISSDDSLLTHIYFKYKDETGEIYSLSRYMRKEDWDKPVKDLLSRTLSGATLKIVKEKFNSFSPELLDISSFPEKFDLVTQSLADKYKHFNVNSWTILPQKNKNGEIVPSVRLSITATKIGGEIKLVKKGVKVEGAKFDVEFQPDNSFIFH